MEKDVIFLHPPSIFDFRERPILWGPINDLIPSKSIFEMYPIGFVSMASTLDKNGYKARIINLALKMLKDPGFEPEDYIKNLKTKIFAIDLHWLPHVHGAIELARLCKQIHPDTPVLMGGLSASYYHDELLREVPSVDFVLRGDSVESPLLDLVNEVTGEERFHEIANLSYRQGSKVEINETMEVPDNLDSFSLDYDYVLKSALKNCSVDNLPYQEFISKPMMTVLTRKGCDNNCPGCGGSSYSYSRICNRKDMAFRSPERVVEDLKQIEEYRTPAFVIGDLGHPDQEYGLEIFRLLRREELTIPVIFEFFSPPGKQFLAELGASVDDFSIEMSPESGVKDIRRAAGRQYSNDELRNTINWAVEAGCQQFDLYFMIGLSGQKRDTISKTMTLIDELLRETPEGTLIPFLSPYSPFLDPGSVAFDFPDKFGFTKYADSLLDHYELLDNGFTWKDFLSYRTDEMSREDLVEITYEFAMDLSRIKKRHGVISSKKLAEIEEKIRLSKRMIQLADGKGDGLLDDGQVRASATELQERLLIDRAELDWSEGITGDRVFAVLKKALSTLFFPG